MGTKNQKGSVSIEHAAGRIRLRWRYQSQRYSLNLFSFSKSNYLQGKLIAVQIEQDLVNGHFDPTLEAYKPAAQIQHPSIQLRLVQQFEEWVRNYRNMDCENDIDYNSTRNMMRRWGTFSTKNVVMHFNSETFGGKTYNRRLTLLKAFFTWLVKAKVVLTNPLEDVIPKKTRRVPIPNRKPFTVAQIKIILESFRLDTFNHKYSNSKHSYYYPFLYFIFKVGVRNAEAVGLRVQHIDVVNNAIHIKEVLARTIKGTNAGARIRKETKNGKHRVLPLTDDLKNILLPLLMEKNPDDLVFTSPTGKAIDDSKFQKRVFVKVLDHLGIERRALYACRHTFGSRCIEKGMTPVMTAFLMGNNPETTLRNYTHQLYIPDTLSQI